MARCVWHDSMAGQCRDHSSRNHVRSTCIWLPVLCIREGNAEAQTWAEALRQHVCQLIAADGVAKADLDRVLQYKREYSVGCML